MTISVFGIFHVPACLHLGSATEVISDLGGSAGKYHTQTTSYIDNKKDDDDCDNDDGNNDNGNDADDNYDDDATCDNVGPLLLLLSPSGHSCTLAKK